MMKEEELRQLFESTRFHIDPAALAPESGANIFKLLDAYCGLGCAHLDRDEPELAFVVSEIVMAITGSRVPLLVDAMLRFTQRRVQAQIHQANAGNN